MITVMTKMKMIVPIKAHRYRLVMSSTMHL